MLIEIQCGNFAGYDEAKREYVPCGERMIVSDEKVGQLVTCTKCHQDIEVPFGIGTVSRSDAASEDSSDSKNPAAKTVKPVSEAPRKTPSSKTAAKKSSSRDNLSKRKPGAAPPNRRPAASKPPSPKPNSRSNQRQSTQSGEVFEEGDLALAAPVELPASDVMALSFGNPEESSTLAEDRNERCKKCGSIAKKGRCTVCKHVEPQFEKLHQPMDEISIEPAGMQRWFCKTMNEGVSIKALEYGAHVGLGVLGFALIMLAVACLFGFGFGGFGGAILLIGVLSFAGLYVGLIFKGHQFLRDPHAKLAWFQRPFWDLMLAISRMMKWEGYDKSLKGRKIITIRDKAFGDNELAELAGLKNCQVLDLEGTSVTDRGLLQLYELNHLHCLVVRRTNVTHEAVFRLQQSYPRLWIWY
jgi:hypothetical protein